ncbi:MAG: MFS transporter [Dehalococcoidia bacterium]|nr:MFS transporter [Dehalococcoidia bacterium]
MVDETYAVERPARLWNRDFLLLWQGQLISQVGQRAFNLAMIFYIKQATGSASLVGLMMMASSLPGVLLGPLGGTFSDNFSRKKIIVYGDLINGLFVLSLAILMFVLPNESGLSLGWLFVVATAGAIIFAFFTPAVQAAVPDLVPENKLDIANSLNQLALFVSLFIGMGLGGILYSATGAAVLFLINGITYFCSSGSEVFIRIPQVPVRKEAQGSVFKKFLADTKEGLQYVWNRKGMRVLFLVAALLYLFIAPMYMLLPFYVEDYLNLDASWYGYLLMSLGIGSALGYLIAGTANVRGRDQSRMIVSSLLGASIAMGIMGFLKQPLIVLGVIFLVGLMAGIFMVKATTVLQLASTSDIRGRVFGLLATLTSGLAPLGWGIGGVIADLANRNIPAIYATCGVLILVLSIAMAFSKETRDFLTISVNPDPGKMPPARSNPAD